MFVQLNRIERAFKLQFHLIFGWMVVGIVVDLVEEGGQGRQWYPGRREEEETFI